MAGEGGSGEWTPAATPVVLVGLDILVAATANLVLELAEVGVGWPPVPVWVFGASLGSGHVYAGTAEPGSPDLAAVVADGVAATRR